jgi:FkbM family methyltransferase
MIQLSKYVPSDRVLQVTASFYARRTMRRHPNKTRILDVGCGTGSAADIFRSANANADYHGIDIATSREARAKTRSDFPFALFDGSSIPEADNKFDIVYSSRVLEHAKDPKALLNEMYRVLKPGGRLIGAISHLQPYHSHSIFNLTPFGFATLALDSGFQIKEIRPGIDGVTLIKRSLSKNPQAFNRYFRDFSPLNRQLIRAAQASDESQSVRALNLKLLSVCGLFGFECSKPGFMFEQQGHIFHFVGEYGRAYSDVFDKGLFYEQDLLNHIAKQSIGGDYLDVGGNIGNHSLFFAGACSSRVVYTLEPLAYLRKRCEANIAANKAGRKIQLQPFGAADATRKDSITFNGREYAVDLVRLDDLLETFRGVRLMKVDAEGMEPQILRGAASLLSNCKPRLYCEALSSHVLSELDDILARSGYKRTGLTFGSSPTHEYKHAKGF